MDLPRSSGSPASLPDRNTFLPTGRNLPGYYSRRSSLVECYGNRRRQSLVELPPTAFSFEERRRLSLVYLDATQQWSLAECSTLHSKSEEIDTSSLSYDMSQGKDLCCPLPSGATQERHNTVVLVSLARRPWRTVILTQLLSLCLATLTVISIYLREVYAFRLHTTLSVGHYLAVCAVFTLCLSRRGRDRGVVSVARCRGWRYFLMALVDVETKYLLSGSLEIATFSTTQLLTCLALPTAVVLSYFVLRARYQSIHVAGLLLGCGSVGFLLWADVIYGSIFNGGTNQLQDILLSISGTILFAATTVMEEWAVKTFDPIEFLGMLGLFGTIVSSVQMGIIESSQAFEKLGASSWYEVSIFIGYALIQFAFSTIAAFMIRDAGATALNLSLITSHFYLNLIKGILLQQTKFHVLYTAQFMAALLGIICFASKRLPVMERNYQRTNR